MTQTTIFDVTIISFLFKLCILSISNFKQLNAMSVATLIISIRDAYNCALFSVRARCKKQ